MPCARCVFRPRTGFDLNKLEKHSLPTSVACRVLVGVLAGLNAISFAGLG